MMLEAGQTALEAGATAAARVAALGAPPAAGDRVSEIRRIVTLHVCPAAEGLVGGCWWSAAHATLGEDGVRSPLRITLRAYADPRNLGEPEPFADASPPNGRRDEGEAWTDVNGNGVYDGDMGAGGSGDYVVYDLEMPQAVGDPALAAVFGSVVWRRATLVTRNEPF
jgi:hypothetical protein